MALIYTRQSHAPRDFDPAARAARHGIRREAPAPEFLEGAVLGNGHMGVIVTTRPDAVKLYFGHNNVLDLRAASVPMSELGTFAELWGKFKTGDRGWLEAYNRNAQIPSERHAPRPWPCGSLLLGFDRRNAELLGHELHIETGLLEVRFLVHGRRETLLIFTELGSDRLWLRMVDARGRSISAPFLRMTLSAQPGLPAQAWRDAHTATFRQVLPCLGPERGGDRVLQVSCRLGSMITEVAPKQPNQLPSPNLKGRGAFFGCVQLRHDVVAMVPVGVAKVTRPTGETYRRALAATRRGWRDYWRQSGVRLDDGFLEETWYRNQYFLNCVARPGALCPTLYGNWPVPDGAPLWSGEYVLDYNAQQLFWAVFSSNHLENNLVYADMIEQILPVARAWARDFYQLPGAFVAQRHWPVATPSIPVPWFGWGNHQAPGPWAIQGLWWHYLYSRDREFLATRAFGPMKAVVEFMNAYLRRPDAHGPASPWRDDKFHIYPTQSPEVWPEHFGEPAFSDAIADLAMTRFLFKAYLEACADLNVAEAEATLLADVREILAHLPDYATKQSPRGGLVWVDVAGAPPDAVYNVPNPLMPVFPGEEHGLHSPAAVLALAANTWRHQQNEGGNDLVFQDLQGARLGLLDLENSNASCGIASWPTAPSPTWSCRRADVMTMTPRGAS